MQQVDKQIFLQCVLQQKEKTRLFVEVAPPLELSTNWKQSLGCAQSCQGALVINLGSVQHKLHSVLHLHWAAVLHSFLGS